MPVKIKGYREALQAGYELLWYRVQEVLGQGTFGITYLCEDLNTDGLVAVKEYLPPQVARREADQYLQPLSDALADDYARGLARFIAEAENLDRFRHPNIVRVVDIFEANNTAYLIMHYERGESLQSALARRGTLSEGELRKLLFPLLEGLEAMHQKGFVHRDIKPSNLFVRANGTAVILDFGSARQLIVSDPQTVTNLVSPGYAPIEQYSSSGDNQGPWTDIYGLGATLYRAATGDIPQSAIARAEAIVHGAPDPFLRAVGHANSKYSTTFLRAIDQALEFKAGDRPQSIDAWRCAFETYGPAKVLPGLAQSRAVDESPTVPTEPETLPLELPLMTDAMAWLPERQQNAHPPGATGAPHQRQQRRTAIEVLRAAAVILAGIGSIWLLAPTPIDQAPALASSASRTSPPSQPPPTVRASSLAALNVDPTVVEQPLPDEINADLSRGFPVPGPIDARPAQPKNATKAGPSVAKLLALAGDDVAAYRLTTPQDNNALAKYRQVLRVEPQNQKAIRGLRAIVAKYVDMAYRQIRRNHLDEAALYLHRAAGIAPKDPSVRQARNLYVKRKIAKARAGSPARRGLTQIERGAGPRNTGQPGARFEDLRRRAKPAP
ncbi:MAG: serine/threonine protein kinase [Pseudomonadota bacterium]|nr:serine/threonine protein kinase [Pseudomonadota bacterium]